MSDENQESSFSQNVSASHQEAEAQEGGPGDPDVKEESAGLENVEAFSTENAQNNVSKEQLVEVISRLNAELEQSKDRTMRTLAEMENLRRRTEKDVANARDYAISNFARDLLSVVDNLDRTVAAFGQLEASSQQPEVNSVLEGVNLTQRQLTSALERHKVKKITAKGERFDPNYHEALFEVPDPSVVAGTIVQVVEEGYAIGERILRPSRVGVATGGPARQPSGDSSLARDEVANDEPGSHVDVTH